MFGNSRMYGMSKHAVVRRAFRAGQAGAIQREDDRQVLEAHFLEDLVEAPLEERRVDIDDRPHPGLGHARGEGDRVALADPDIEEPIGEILADFLQLVPLAHGCGQDGDFRVVLHGLVDGETGMASV
jgi:hypothetical protein